MANCSVELIGSAVEYSSLTGGPWGRKVHGQFVVCNVYTPGSQAGASANATASLGNGGIHKEPEMHHVTIVFQRHRSYLR
jgi:hypothetical protein